MKVVAFIYYFPIKILLNYSAEHHHLQNPHGGMTIPVIVDDLFKIGDINDDGNMTQAEFEREFITNFDHDGKCLHTSGCGYHREFCFMPSVS